MNEYRRSVDGVVDAPERESRRVGRGVELREETDGSLIFEGYATIYDYRYEVAGGPPYGFFEMVARGAAAKSVLESDVRLLVNHDGMPLARTKSKTLTLTSDDVGLHVRAQLDPSNPVIVELRSAMGRGDIDEMSMAFRAIRQEWNEDYTERVIRELKLYDVSIVTYPANPATVALIRSDEPASVGMPLGLATAQAEALRA